MENIEIEAKALLSESDYEKLIKVFPFDSYSQINHYIETPSGDLKKKGFSLRVREKGESLIEMTMKKDLIEGKLETNIALSKKELADLINDGTLPNNEIKDTLIGEGINLDELEIIASLTTKRIDVSYEGGLLSIDMNAYNGIVDYEIELEHQSQELADSILKNLLESNGIVYKKNTKSKTRRAFETLEK